MFSIPYLKFVGLKRVNFFLFAVAFLLVFIINLPVSADADLWGHTYFGLDHIRSGYLRRIDPYSFTALHHLWINHEWLSELIFGYSFLLGGGAGLFVMRALVLLATSIGLSYLYYRKCKNWLISLLLFVLAEPFLSAILNCRPHIFTYFLIVAYMIILQAYEDHRTKFLLLMPPLMVLWTNLHGGFIVGLGIGLIGILSVYYKTKAYADPKLRWLPVLILCSTIAAICINPYGTSLLVYLAKALTMKRTYIVEYQPINKILFPFYLSYVLLPLVLMLLAKSWTKFYQAVFFFASAWQAYFASRFLALLIIFGSLVAADCMRQAWDNYCKLRQKKSVLGPYVTAMALGVICLFLSIYYVEDARHPSARYRTVMVDASAYPADAVNFLKSNDYGPNLAVCFSWGEYCIWHLYPRYKVSIDGRYETVYPLDFANKNLKAYHDGDLQRFLEDGPVHSILIHSGTKIDKALKSRPQWVEIYRDPLSVVYTQKAKVHKPCISLHMHFKPTTENLRPFP